MGLRTLVKKVFRIKRIESENEIKFSFIGINVISFRYTESTIDMLLCPLGKRVLSLPIEEPLVTITKYQDNSAITSMLANLETLQLVRKNKDSTYNNPN